MPRTLNLSTTAGVKNEAELTTPTLEGLDLVLSKMDPAERDELLSTDRNLKSQAMPIYDELQQKYGDQLQKQKKKKEKRGLQSIYIDCDVLQMVMEEGKQFFDEFLTQTNLFEDQIRSLASQLRAWFEAEAKRRDAIRWNIDFANAKVTGAIRTTNGDETTTTRTTISVGHLSSKLDKQRLAQFSVPRRTAIKQARDDPALHSIVTEAVGSEKTSEGLRHASAIYAITSKMLQSATEGNSNHRRDQQEVEWKAVDEIPTNNGGAKESVAVEVGENRFAVELANGDRFVVKAGSIQDALEICGVPKKNKPEGNHQDKEKRKEGSASAATKEDQCGLLLQLENGQMALASGLECAKALQKVTPGPAANDAPALTLADIFALHEAMLTAAAFAANVPTHKIKKFLSALQGFAAGRRIDGEDYE